MGWGRGTLFLLPWLGLALILLAVQRRMNVVHLVASSRRLSESHRRPLLILADLRLIDLVWRIPVVGLSRRAVVRPRGSERPDIRRAIPADYSRAADCYSSTRGFGCVLPFVVHACILRLIERLAVVCVCGCAALRFDRRIQPRDHGPLRKGVRRPGCGNASRRRDVAGATRSDRRRCRPRARRESDPR